MIDFSSYEKMPTSLKKLGLSESDYSALDKLKWVVTEKVHGANFSFVYQDKTLKYAKRKEYLAWSDDFFGFQLVVAKREDQILRLFEKLSAEIEADKYIIYGELFGGEYPHSDVKADTNVQAIQTGVFYSPIIGFCAFDIAIEKNGVKNYLDYETAIQYFKNQELMYAEPLLISKFGEALNFNTRINSTIPKQFNLPELPYNLIEGVVVKPYNLKPEDSLTARPIIKLKNPEFEEDKKFHNAQKWSYIPVVSSSTEDLSFIVEELRNYVTPNRLDNAISKIGPLDFTNEQRISAVEKELLQDAITDFDEVNKRLLEDLNDKQKVWIEARIKSDVRMLIIDRESNKITS